MDGAHRVLPIGGERDTRATVACDTGLPPRRNRCASSRDDQCVNPSSAGGSVSVIERISSRTACGIVGGLPGRGSSTSPVDPRSANRDRHRITVGSLHQTREMGRAESVRTLALTAEPRVALSRHEQQQN